MRVNKSDPSPTVISPCFLGMNVPRQNNSLSIYINTNHKSGQGVPSRESTSVYTTKDVGIDFSVICVAVASSLQSGVNSNLHRWYAILVYICEGTAWNSNTSVMATFSLHTTQNQNERGTDPVITLTALLNFSFISLHKYFMLQA